MPLEITIKSRFLKNREYLTDAHAITTTHDLYFYNKIFTLQPWNSQCNGDRTVWFGSYWVVHIFLFVYICLYRMWKDALIILTNQQTFSFSFFFSSSLFKLFVFFCLVCFCFCFFSLHVDFLFEKELVATKNEMLLWAHMHVIATSWTVNTYYTHSLRSK